MTAYTGPGMIPISAELLAELEADARAIYGVPDDWQGSAMSWLQDRTRRTLDRIENLYAVASMEDDGHNVSFGLGCNCDRCRARRRYEASV